MSEENIDGNLVSIKHLSGFNEVDIAEMGIKVEYRSFCLVYHQVYDETQPFKLNER